MIAKNTTNYTTNNKQYIHMWHTGFEAYHNLTKCLPYSNMCLHIQVISRTMCIQNLFSVYLTDYLEVQNQIAPI